MSPTATIEVHPAARSEIQAAHVWYHQHNADAADAFLAEIDRAIREISESPDRWAPYLDDSRRLVLRRFPFSVVYRHSKGVVVIVAFAHHRRRPGYWRGRSR